MSSDDSASKYRSWSLRPSSFWYHIVDVATSDYCINTDFSLFMSQIPANQAPDMAQGNAFLPSFGIAVAIFTPIVTSLPYLSGCELPDLSAREAAGPGILSGFIYNIGNMLNIVAIFYVGSSVAYPLFQCGIIVAGIWGMLYFEESHGNALITLWAADVVLLVGIILLSLTH